MSEAGEVEFLGISDLREAYRRGRLSPVAIVEKSLARAESINAVLNAFTTICREHALAQAAEVERAFREHREPGPLAGVPVTVKDILPTKGIRTTLGSAAFATHVPAVDAVSVERLKKAGAIIIGKTATPEFACRQTTSSPVSGVTRNPWHLDLTPGGSSGGSAAATAAGVGVVSLVTDGGGSARLPAACTGLVGMKPTFGRIAYDGALDAFAGLGHIGVIARNSADLGLALSTLAGAHPKDPYSLERATIPLAPAMDSLAGLRFGLRRRLGCEPIDAEIDQAFDEVAHMVEGLGGSLTVLDDEIEPPLPIWRVLQHSIWAERYGDRPAVLEQIDPVMAAGIDHAKGLSARDLQAALHGRTRLFRHVQGWFECIDFIMSPTLTRPPLPATHPGHGPVEVSGQPAGDIREGWGPLLGLFTMTGHPALTLNCGWTANGLPIGMHLVGRWHADAEVLSVAGLLERAMPEARWRMPPLFKENSDPQKGSVKP
jgi:aspartyl-tRNA(Asn)/glutamyl-tRNA(Gln) amidotransferase subunit A